MLYLFSMRGDFYTAPSRALFALAVLALLANIVYGNQFMDTFQSCSQSFNGGFSYDLTPLVRTAGHRDYVLTGANGEVVFINVCAQVQNIPVSCRRDPDAVRGNAYVELNPSEGQICRSLGSNVHWKPIDEKNPELGVDLIYTGGDVCTDGKPASARIRVLCDRDHTMGVAEDYPVERDRNSPCSYIVTWPSLYGCPIRTSSSVMMYFLLIAALSLFAMFRSGICSGIFQASGSHDDDFSIGSGTSQVSRAAAARSSNDLVQVLAHDACASVLHRLRDSFHSIVARFNSRSRSNADLYGL